jgi:hypothetical protein
LGVGTTVHKRLHKWIKGTIDKSGHLAQCRRRWQWAELHAELWIALISSPHAFSYKTYSLLMDLPVEDGRSIVPASVATQLAKQCLRPLCHSGAVQRDWSRVAYSTTVIPKQS